jgi:hypothetical protein
MMPNNFKLRHTASINQPLLAQERGNIKKLSDTLPTVTAYFFYFQMSGG